MLDFPNWQPPTRPWGRRQVAWALGIGLLSLCLPGQTQGIDPNLPLRNLVVEWRIEGQGQTRDSGAGVRQGRVIIDQQNVEGGCFHAALLVPPCGALVPPDLHKPYTSLAKS